MSATPELDGLARRAAGGDAAALEQLVAALRDDVYRLALRMLWHPHDAEDASQEILIRIVTGLGSFRGESSIRTWAYRVAANHLLTTRRRRMERPELSFDAFADDLGQGMDTPYDAEAVDEALLAEEVRVGCTNGMLLCLDREHRLAYILGDVVELSGPEAAAVLEIEPAAYRKRLQRARERVEAFTRAHCGIVSTSAACRCERRIGAAIACGRIDPANLLHATRPSGQRGGRPARELHAIRDAAALFRAGPERFAPDTLTSWLRSVIASGSLTITR